MHLTHFPAAPVRPVGRRMPVAADHPGMGGIFDTVLGVAGGVISGIFGSSEADKQRRLEQRSLEYQRQIAMAALSQQDRLARLNAQTQDRAIEATKYLAEQRLRAELQSQRAQQSTMLEAQQQQVAAQNMALSHELADRTQQGIFGLAQSGFTETGASLREYPTRAAQAMTLIAIGSFAAIALTGRRKKKKAATA